MPRYSLSVARLATSLTLVGLLAACRPPASKPVTPPVPTPTAKRPSLQMLPALSSLATHWVVPAPSSVSPATGAPFTLTAASTIVVPSGNADASRIAEAFAAIARRATGYPLPVTPSDGPAPAGAIALRLGGASSLGNEGYELTIGADSVRIVAGNSAGLFYGTQTLRQLFPAWLEAQQSELRMTSAWTVPAGHITDQPRFAYRAAMLDVARHFFTVDEVQQVIDLLALYKLNTLHLHLADDQGWRIQIDSWPKLTTVGGSTQVGGGPGGFYTKQDYANIVRYAQDRFITIVPEIDMPGHTNGAIASYPELGCSRPTPGIYGGTQPLGVYTGIQVGWSTLCPDSEVTYRFVDDVVREISQMTPGPYFHVGGDEVHVLPADAYIRFVQRVQDIVYKYGKTMVGWEEIGKARLRPTTIAQQWQSDSALLALRQGAKLILSPAQKSYVDMKYGPTTELGLDWAGYLPLETAYNWDPVTYLPGVTESSVLGVEAPLWSETVHNLTSAQYMLMPRLPAIAEVGWSQKSVHNWESFRTRIAAHAPRWRLLGINYYPSPQVAW
jgi:hexosaminidase